MGTYIIIECQSDFMTIHYYSDNQCQNEIFECMNLWQSNTLNPNNLLYFESINFCVGEVRTFAYGDPLSDDLGIDTETTLDPFHDAVSIQEPECNYINKHKYKEPINKCNEYSLLGTKHSYKYICSDIID